MKRSINLAAVAVVLVGGTAALASSASATNGQRTIKLTVHEASFHYSDVGPQGISPGDGFQISDDLYQSGKKVGVDALSCVQITTVENLCSVSLTLNGRGDVELQGISRTTTDGDTYTVLGGTGQFLHTGGTLETSGDSSTPKGGTSVLRLDG